MKSGCLQPIIIRGPRFFLDCNAALNSLHSGTMTLERTNDVCVGRQIDLIMIFYFGAILLLLLPFNLQNGLGLYSTTFYNSDQNLIAHMARMVLFSQIVYVLEKIGNTFAI